MPLTELHELHSRRWSRNLGLGVVLGGAVVLIFALTLVKVTLEGADRPPAALPEAVAPAVQPAPGAAPAAPALQEDTP